MLVLISGLALGDRLRVVAPVQHLPELARYFGDSERALAEVDFSALALGLALGLLLAQLPLPFPGGGLKLGNAGGPLLVALLLGHLGRSGSWLWSLPYETNSVLRTWGLLVFLASVGLGSGGALREVLAHEGLSLLLLGALVTFATNLLALLLLHNFCRAGVIESMGCCSGAQTQPATLAVAYELSGRAEQTYVAYAMSYPIAMIAKILMAQLIAAFA
ncbi:MAG: hypothetical protein RL701_3084 [Pseudomonadota bacterium]